ncbi:MAG: class I SAM-dependent methyltransferase [Candidatus Aminicenantes bacterium]
MRHNKIITSFLIFILLSVSNGFGIGADVCEQQKSVLDPINEDEARLNRLMPPDKVLEIVGVSPGMTVAEIGAGKGRYIVHLAVRVGKAGKVFAEDIDASALEFLENRCKRWDLENVEIILGEETDPKLPRGEVDIIFVVSSYHHFDDPVSLLRNARSALKPEGKLAVVEWIPWNRNDREGTPPAKLEEEMKAAGYRLERLESLDLAKKLNIYIFRVENLE